LLEFFKNFSAGKPCPELIKHIPRHQASQGDVKTLLRTGAGWWSGAVGSYCVGVGFVNYPKCDTREMGKNSKNYPKCVTRKMGKNRQGKREKDS
jgi:hypothetical protein